MVFEEQPLSSDLEWMLESGQAGQDLLAQALVDEFYTALYQLTFAVLGDAETAAYTTITAFVRSLVSVHTFRGSETARIWFFRIALGEIGKASRATRLKPIREVFHPAGRAVRKSSQEDTPGEVSGKVADVFTGLSPRSRQIVFLHYSLGWETSEIARLLKSRPGTIQSIVGEFASRLSGLPEEGGGTIATNNQARIAEGLRLCSPDPDPDEASLARVAALVYSEAQKQAGSLRWTFRLREIALTGAAVLGVAALFWGLNTFLPEEDRLQKPSSSATQSHLALAQPTTASSPTPTPGPIFFYLPQQGETLQTAAAKIGGDPQELADLNDIPLTRPLEYGQVIYLDPEHLTPLSPPAQPPVSRMRLFANLSVLDSVKLQQRMLDSSAQWQSLWLNAWVIDYGPSGYVGPPEVQWAQVWLHQPDRGLQILHFESDGPDQWTLDLDGRVYHSMGMENWNWVDVSHGLLASSPLHDLVFPDRSRWMVPGSRLEIDGTEMVAYRQTIVTNWYNPDGFREYRLWVDDQTGIVLQALKFGGSSYSSILEKIVVDTVSYNPDSIPAIFKNDQTWQAYLARDFSRIPHGNRDPDKPAWTWGPVEGHLQLPINPPPEGFDPSTGQLTLQYPLNLPQQPLAGALRPVVYVFSGDYYLGSVRLFYPFSTVCSRSRDGKLVAFGSSRSQSEDNLSPGDQGLSWFSVDHLERVFTLGTPALVRAVAIAPDNRKVAFSGVLANESRSSGIFIHNISSGTTQTLREDEAALDLVWNPAGDQLAWVSFTEGHLSWTVMEPTGRKIVYEQTSYISPSDFVYLHTSLQAPPEMPVDTWGVEFPVLNLGLAGCLEMPVQ